MIPAVPPGCHRAADAIVQIALRNDPDLVTVDVTCRGGARRFTARFTVYNAGHGVLDHGRIRIRVVKRHRSMLFEDYSGWITYRHASLELDGAH